MAVARDEKYGSDERHRLDVFRPNNAASALPVHWIVTNVYEKIGDRFRPRIDETIRVYDKLLLVLSKVSVTSQWVEQEVETALARERQQGTTILFPVRIDNTVMTLETGWPALIRNTRNIGDFRRWKTHGAYQQAFARLLRDLTTAAQKPDAGP